MLSVLDKVPVNALGCLESFVGPETGFTRWHSKRRCVNVQLHLGALATSEKDRIAAFHQRPLDIELKWFNNAPCQVSARGALVTSTSVLYPRS